MTPSDLPVSAVRDLPPLSPGDASVYVHFPYCSSKCPYCDFNSHVVAHDDVVYADAVLSELDRRSPRLRVPAGGLASVYFGGGTPSRWHPEQLGRVLRALADRFGLREGVEITVEANPEDVGDGALFAALRDQGVNRFSLGVQSFLDDELAALGRMHDGDRARAAVRAARATGARVSLDLIYGLPEQPAHRALASVEAALALEPDHISAYTLTIEPDTVLARRVRLGTFRPMPDEQQADLIEAVTHRLEAEGYRRYEVSSYAREGRISIHNTGYWVGGAYLGLGAGAHGYLPHAAGAVRYENERLPQRYQDAALAGALETRFEEERGRRGQIEDRALVALRSAFGVDADAWAREFGPGWRSDAFVDGLERLARQGFVERRDGRWRPNPRGFLFNDAVARAMIDLSARCWAEEGPLD